MRKELIITRIFDAPLERVWKAWTDPEEVKKWWGPKGFTAPVVQLDFREGGKYLYCMRGAVTPGGKEQDFWSTGVFKEIVPMERIVVTDSFADEKGNKVPASHYGMQGKDWPMELTVEETFVEHDGKTELTLRHSGFPSDQVEGARAGWSTSLDKLAESLDEHKEREPAHAAHRETAEM